MKNATALLFSFLITLLYYVAITTILIYFADAKGSIDAEGNIMDATTLKQTIILINIPIAVIMTMIAIKLKSGLYKECFSPLGIFLFIFIFGPVGMIFSLWGLLRVKFGNVTLKAPSIN